MANCILAASGGALPNEFKETIMSQSASKSSQVFSIQALKGAWARAQKMSPREFSHLSHQIQDQIGELHEYRYRLAESGHDDLVEFLNAVMRVCGLRPVIGKSLKEILHTDPRSRFQTHPMEWLMNLHSWMPKTLDELHELWTDSSLDRNQRVVLNYVVTSDMGSALQFAHQSSQRRALNKNFRKWIQGMAKAFQSRPQPLDDLIKSLFH